jgi:diaminohydroxyphosphoribosylaminopyrimidine deaminase / 5-amino-6-(5-phosphoribosylamino)uracil reductase
MSRILKIPSDHDFMWEAYRAAICAIGNSDPNPAVGAVLVDANGAILARGFTQRPGGAHAERHVLAQLPDTDLSDATLYVTLEPCCHHGRTPPCTDIIIERRIKRVVVARRDFAAEVAGKSVGILLEQGIDVAILDDQSLHREAWLTTGPFFFTRRYGRPRVCLKWAQTADGYLAPQQGPSGKISGTTAAHITATLRSMFKLTLASPGTARIDLPRLDIRRSETTVDLANTGLSAFFQVVMHQQQVVMRSAPEYWATAYRGFLVESGDELTKKRLAEGQSKLDSSFFIEEFSPQLMGADFIGTMTRLLEGLLERGHNSVLLEAGPVFSELMLAAGLADAVAIYASRDRTSTQLWGAQGRGNSMSRELATHGGSQFLPAGFQLLETARLPEDDFYFFIKPESSSE